MTGPSHYRQGEEWLARAEKAHARLLQEPTAAKEAESAAAIAAAHFAAARVAVDVHASGRNGRSVSETVEWERTVGLI
jgi:hypothetical protein